MSTGNKDTALAVQITPTGLMSPQNVAEAIEVARMIAHSGMVPKAFIDKPGAVLVAMQMGAEVGLPPMAAIQNIAVINGRPSMWGDAMLGLVTSNPLCEDVVEWASDDGQEAFCTVKRSNRSPVTRSFSFDDAKRAGLTGKGGPWSQYPKRMLQLRARGFALRDSFPDLLRGITPAEEARDIQEDIIDQGPFTPLEPGTHSVAAKKEQAPARKQKSKAKSKAKAEPEAPPQPEQPLPGTEEQPPLGSWQDSTTPELSEGAAELLGMVAHTESHDDIDLLLADVGRRRLKAAERAIITTALKDRSRVLASRQEGKEEPGSDG